MTDAARDWIEPVGETADASTDPITLRMSRRDAIEMYRLTVNDNVERRRRREPVYPDVEDLLLALLTSPRKPTS